MSMGSSIPRVQSRVSCSLSIFAMAQLLSIADFAFIDIILVDRFGTRSEHAACVRLLNRRGSRATALKRQLTQFHKDSFSWATKR